MAKSFILTTNPRKRPREEKADISATMLELQGQLEGKVKEAEDGGASE